MALITLPVKVTVEGKETLVQVEANLENIDKARKKTQEGFSGFGAVMQGVAQGFGQAAFGVMKDGLEAITGVVTRAVSGVMRLADSLSNLRAQTGAGVEGLQRLAGMGAPVGVTLEQIAAGIGKMQQSLVTAPEKFAAIGLSAQKLMAMDPAKAFESVGKAIGSIADPAQRATAAIEIFGKSGAVLVRMFGDDMEAAGRKAQELGLILSKDVIGAADDLGDEVGLLGQTWEGLFNNFAAGIVTSEPLHVFIEGLTTLLGKLSVLVQQNQGAIRQWVDLGIVFLAQALVEIVNIVGYVLTAWTGMQIAAIGLGMGFEELGTKAYLFGQVLTGNLSIAQAWKASQQANVDLQKRAADEIDKELAANKARQAVVGEVRTAFEGLVGAVANSVGATHHASEANREHAQSSYTDAAALKAQAAEAKKAAEETSKYFAAFDKEKAAAAAKQLQDLEKAWQSVFGTAHSGEAIAEASVQFLNLKASVEASGKAIEELGQQDLARLEEQLQKVYTLLRGTPMGDAVAEQLGRVRAALREYGVGIEQAGTSTTKAAEQMAKAAAETGRWADAVATLAGALASLPGILGQIGGSLGGVAALGKLMEKMVASGVDMAAVWKSGSFANWGQQSGGQKAQTVAGAAAGAADVYGTAQQADSGWAAQKQGADKGMATGGWIGAIVGSVVGWIGYMRRPEWRRAIQDIGKQYGFALSEGVGKGIEESMKKLDISRKLAETLHIGDIMAEGIAAGKDPEAFLPQVMDLMKALADGTLPAKEGVEQLGTAFTELAKVGVSSTGMASGAMVAMIMQARALGLQIPEITDYVKEQIQSAVEGVIKFIHNVDLEYVSLSARAEHAIGIKPLPGKGPESGAVDMGTNEQVMTENAQDAATIFSGVFWAAVAELGLVAAADAMGPAFQELKKKIRAAGLEMPEELSSLNRIFKFVKDPEFRAAFDALDGISQAMKGMQNAGYMTTGMFDALNRSAEDTYNKILSKTHDTHDAMMAVAPYIQQILDSHARYGTEIPEWVQKLMKEHPEIKFNVDPLLQVVDILTKIAVAMGAIPPTVDTTVRVGVDDPNHVLTYNGKPVHAGGSSDDPTAKSSEYPGGFAYGGFSTGPKSGHWELLHGPETIVPSSMFGQPLWIPPGGGAAQVMSGSSRTSSITMSSGAIVINQQPGQDSASLARQVVAAFVADVKARGDSATVIQDLHA